MTSSSVLENLRAELAELDGHLLETVARRRDLVSQIGRVKEEHGIATRDYGQEKVVLQRARERARQVGVDEEVAANLMVQLIRSSLKVQERQRVAAEGEGAGQTALVIGGAGKIGGWFVRFLANQGYRVEVADPAGTVDGYECTRDWATSALEQDVIVVAAPLGHTSGILKQLALRKPAGIVFDVGSLKTPLREGLQALHEAGVQVTSVHPMFGPDVELLSGKHVLFVDVGVPEATAKARALFDSTMAVQMEMSLDEHDRLIAYILGLSHAVNIAFFTALAESTEDAPRLATLSSSTFQAQLEVAARVASENPHLYYEIQALNEFGEESLSALNRAVNRLTTAVKNGDEEAFIALMEQGAGYLSGIQIQK